jgi:phage shock protein A
MQMGLIKKMLTLLRGATAEAGMAVVDAQAFRIADQEQRDADAALARAKRDLVVVMAERAVADRDLQKLRTDMATREAQARAAIQSGQDDLASDVAERLAELAEDEFQRVKLIENLDARIDRLRAAVTDIGNRLHDLRRRFRLAQATASVQRAERLVRGDAASGAAALHDAETSLSRITERQEQEGARLDAAASLAAEHPGSRLDHALAKAGLLARKTPDAAAILRRLRGEAATV